VQQLILDLAAELDEMGFHYEREAFGREHGAASRIGGRREHLNRYRDEHRNAGNVERLSG